MDFEGIDFSVVLEFVVAAIGFVVLAIAIALAAARWSKKKQQQDKQDSSDNRQNVWIGLMFGVGMGISFGMSLDNWLFGISMGVLWSVVMTNCLAEDRSKAQEGAASQEDLSREQIEDSLVQELVEMEQTL